MELSGGPKLLFNEHWKLPLSSVSKITGLIATQELVHAPQLSSRGLYHILEFNWYRTV